VEDDDVGDLDSPIPIALGIFAIVWRDLATTPFAPIRALATPGADADSLVMGGGLRSHGPSANVKNRPRLSSLWRHRDNVASRGGVTLGCQELPTPTVR